MSEYTKSYDKIFFLNDKNVISSLNDETVLLNPVTSQKVTQNVFNKLNGQDTYISGEVKNLCSDISIVSNDISTKFEFVDQNFVHISGDSIQNLSVNDTLTATTGLFKQVSKETGDPHTTTLSVGIDGILLSVHGDDRSINIDTDNQLRINRKDLSSYFAETAESAYSESKEYIASEILKLSCADESVQHQFVVAVTESNGTIAVSRAQPTSADIDQLTNYVTTEIRLSNDALSTEVSAQMYKSAQDLSTYINDKVRTVYKPMGSVETFDELLEVQHSWTDAPSCHIGEVWNVISGTQEQPDLSGQNFVWVDQGSEGEHKYGWDRIGGWIDFHQFYTKTETNSITSSLSTSLTGWVDNAFVRQDGSDAVNHLSVVNGLTAETNYIEEIHANPGEYTKLSVGSQGLTLSIDGNRSIDVTVPNGYNGITVNGETLSAFVESHGGGGSGTTKNPLSFYDWNGTLLDSFDGSVQKVLKAGQNVTFSNSGNVITINSTGGGSGGGHYFDLEKNNTVSTETTFLSNVYADFRYFRDQKGRMLSDVVSVENRFESLYSGIANIKAECKLDYIEFNAASQMSVAFSAINQIAIDPTISVDIEPLNVETAVLSDGFNALCSIILSAKYNVSSRSVEDEFEKIDRRFNNMVESIAAINLRLSAIETFFSSYKFVVEKK